MHKIKLDIDRLSIETFPTADMPVAANAADASNHVTCPIFYSCTNCDANTCIC